jgi:hypothetical protein
MISFFRKLFFRAKQKEKQFLFTDIYEHVNIYPVADGRPLYSGIDAFFIHQKNGRKK